MTVATRSRRTDSGTVLKFGPKYNESSSTWGTWSAAATSRARVVFPDPVLPMIRIRLHPSRLVEGSRRVEVIGSIITARAIERGIVFDRPPGGLESAQLVRGRRAGTGAAEDLVSPADRGGRLEERSPKRQTRKRFVVLQ